MDYQRHYNLLIERAKYENRKKYKISDERYIYYERHHIIPKCLGGDNDSNNLILLTPEEHYLAHQLLVKIYPHNTGLLFAAIRMTISGHGERMNNKLYSWLRKRHSENTILLHKEKKCGMYGKTHSAKTKQKMKDSSPHISRKGKDSPSYGLKRSAETRDKISKARTGVSTGTRTEETKQRMRESSKNRIKTDYTAKQISINGIIFPSATNAARYIGITVSAFCKRMRNGKYPNYFYV